MRTPFGFLTLTFSLLTAACEQGSGETAADSTGAVETDTAAVDTDTTAASSPADTGEAPTSAGPDTDPSQPDEQTTAADDAGDDAGDDDAGDDAGDTGEPDDTTTGTSQPFDRDIDASCIAYCARWAECGAPGDQDECVAGCNDSIGPVEGACKAAYLDQLACVTALSCEALFDDGDVCVEQEAAIGVACDGGGPGSCVAGVGERGDGCDYSLICDDEPVRSMECDDATCVCLIDEVKVGECASAQACSELDGLADKAEACCDF